MVAEAPDQHHGGPGRKKDGRNGLTGPNIVKHRRGFERNKFKLPFSRFPRRSLEHFMLKFVNQLTDFQYHSV